MFLDLKSSIIKTEPLAYPSIFLSIPNTIRYLSHQSCDRFQIAAQQAGLQLLRPCNPASRAMLYYHYIEDCVGDLYPDDQACRPDIQTALTIEYSSSSLEVAIVKREDGMFEISRNELNLNLGAGSTTRGDDEVGYWDSIKKFVVEVIGNEEVDALFLLGEQNKEEIFREVIKEIILERERGKSFGQLIDAVDKDMGDGLWYASRGAAAVARGFMWQGPNACLPNPWCEITSYHDEL
jgi:hypothetical protein